MGNWFSSNTEVNGAAVLDTSSVHYHGPTLAWSAGALAFAALAISLVCFIRKYWVTSQRNLVSSIHHSRDQQREIEMALLSRQPLATAAAFPPPSYAQAVPMPPAPPSTPLPFVQGVSPSVMAPCHAPYQPGAPPKY